MLGKTFSVELCMYHPQNPEIKILTSRTDYTFKPVAKIGDVSYGTLADALSALKQDETLEILRLVNTP